MLVHEALVALSAVVRLDERFAAVLNKVFLQQRHRRKHFWTLTTLDLTTCGMNRLKHTRNLTENGRVMSGSDVAHLKVVSE